ARIGGDHPARLSTPWRPIANQVARAKDGKNPYQGRIVNLKPHAYKRAEPYGGRPPGGWRAFCIMIPRLTVPSEVKRLWRAAEAKASLTRASQLAAVDAKPRDLRMGRMKWG